MLYTAYIFVWFVTKREKLKILNKNVSAGLHKQFDYILTLKLNKLINNVISHHSAHYLFTKCLVIVYATRTVVQLIHKLY